MYRNLAIAGATVVAIAGVGTAALAVDGSSATSGSGTTSSARHSGKHAGKDGKHHKRGEMLRHAVHGSIVTKGKDGYVAHSVIRGTVSSVSATSISVKASDGYTETFTISKTTKVRAVSGAKGSRKASASSIAKVKSGDAVRVIGKAPEKSQANPSATAVVDGIHLKK